MPLCIKASVSLSCPHLPYVLIMNGRQRSFNREKGRHKENKSRPVQRWFRHVGYPRSEVSTRIETSKYHRGARFFLTILTISLTF